MAAIELVKPILDRLPAFVAALDSGWSPDNVRWEATRLRFLEQSKTEPEKLIASFDDREARGGPIIMADGSTVKRLPGFVRWIVETATDDFCGSIGFRWQSGTCDLPPTCLGHMGYGIVPAKRGRGYASAALGLMLNEARTLGMDYIAITTQPDNIASQKVITANGGVLFEEFIEPPQLGGRPAYRYRIKL